VPDILSSSLMASWIAASRWLFSFPGLWRSHILHYLQVDAHKHQQMNRVAAHWLNPFPRAAMTNHSSVTSKTKSMNIIFKNKRSLSTVNKTFLFKRASRSLDSPACSVSLLLCFYCSSFTVCFTFFKVSSGQKAHSQLYCFPEAAAHRLTYFRPLLAARSRASKS